MIERGGTPEGLSFSEDELSELGATLARGTPVRAATPRSEGAPGRALSLTPTVRQFAFSPLDTLVEAAFARLEPRQRALRSDWSALAADHVTTTRADGDSSVHPDGIEPAQLDASARSTTIPSATLAPAASVAPPAPKARPVTARGLAPLARPTPPTAQSAAQPVLPDVIFCSSPPPDAALLQLDCVIETLTPVCVAAVTPSYGEGFRCPEPAPTPQLSPQLSVVPAAENELDDEEEMESVELEEEAPAQSGKPAPPALPAPARPTVPPALPPGLLATGAPTMPAAAVIAPPPAAPPMPQGDAADGEPRASRRGKAWFETLFDENYLPTQPAVAPQQTARELDFLAGALGLDSRSKLLDVGCGTGRHAIGLASRGHDVTGLDLSLPLLLRAAEDARLAGANVRFVHEDMRHLAFDGEFDAAYCCATSFGYFDDETNLAVVAAIAKALGPHGRFLLDIVNRDYLVGELPTRVWWQGDGCMVLEEVDFNGYTSRLQSHRSVAFEDGRQIEHELSIRAYSLHEIGKLLHRAGFRVTEVSGSFHSRGHFLGAASRQLIVVGEKK